MAKAKKRKPKKKERIVLSKQQKIQASLMIRLENRISTCKEYIQLWSKFFQFFAEDIYERQIKPEEEKAFFQTITILSRKQFLFCELMGDAFDEGDDIMSVLTVSVSLATIKGMDEGTLSKLELDWHELFLSMNVALGRLLRQVPAGMKLSDLKAQADKTRSKIKKKDKAEKKNKKAAKAEAPAAAESEPKKKKRGFGFGKKAKA